MWPASPFREIQTWFRPVSTSGSVPIASYSKRCPESRIPDGIPEQPSPLASVSGGLTFPNCGSSFSAKKLYICVSQLPTVTCAGHDLCRTLPQSWAYHKPCLSSSILFGGRGSSPGMTFSPGGSVRSPNLFCGRNPLWFWTGCAVALWPYGLSPWRFHEPASPAIWNALDLSPCSSHPRPLARIGTTLCPIFYFLNNLDWKAEVNINFSMRHSWSPQGDEHLLLPFWIFQELIPSGRYIEVAHHAQKYTLEASPQNYRIFIK